MTQRQNETKSSLRSVLLALFILMALISMTGCGSSFTKFYFGDLFGGDNKSTVDKNPDQLAVDGMRKMQQKDYSGALKDFRQLKEHYPYSKYAPLAELKLGDAYYNDKKYSEAAVAYEEFARLHPRNEVIPYVLYQIAMCHFLNFSTTDRDPATTKTAVDSFQRLIQAYPQSEYAERARKQVFECQKRVIMSEYTVGLHYYRIGEYQSAKDRFEKVLNTYPEAARDLGYEKPIKEMLTECEKEVAKGPKKPSIWTRAGF